MNKILYLGIIFFLLSCTKYNLERDNVYDKKNPNRAPEPTAKIVGSNSCSTLNGIISSFRYWDGTKLTTSNWCIDNSGFLGSCFSAPDPSISSQATGNHYIQFNRAFSNKGYIELWIKTSKLGYDNILPNVYIDGVPQNTPTIIGGKTSSFEFMQIRTDFIEGGSHTIKFDFTGNYYNFYVDEIKYYEF